MRTLSTYILALTLVGCGTQKEEKSSVSVANHGILREIMMEQKLEARVKLSSFENKAHVYALGAMESLKGEILILNSQPLNGITSNGELLMDKSFQADAALLVSSEVQDWISTEIDLEIADLKTLEAEIVKAADEAGIDTDNAFPFRLKGKIDQLNWHVINAAEATEQNHEAYKKAGLSGVEQSTEVEVLGFYSEKHEGVFTHHGSYLHMHFVNDAHSIMGHVDNLKLDGRITLMLPKTESYE